MNIKPLTAVEFLQQKYYDNNYNIFLEDFEQAKDIEKEQIIDAYHINPKETKWYNEGIEYYKETYEH